MEGEEPLRQKRLGDCLGPRQLKLVARASGEGSHRGRGAHGEMRAPAVGESVRGSGIQKQWLWKKERLSLTAKSSSLPSVAN